MVNGIGNTKHQGLLGVLLFVPLLASFFSINTVLAQTQCTPFPTGQAQLVKGPQRIILSATPSPDGQSLLLFSVNGERMGARVSQVNFSPGHALDFSINQTSTEYTEGAYSPDGKYLVLKDSLNSAVEIRNLETGKVDTVPVPYLGKMHLVSGGGDSNAHAKVILESVYEGYLIRDLQTGEEKKIRSGRRDSVGSEDVSANGDILFRYDPYGGYVGTFSSETRIFNDSAEVLNLKTGEKVKLPFIFSAKAQPRLAQDGKKILYLDAKSNKPFLYDLDSGEKKAIPISQSEDVRALEFSIDGRSVVIGSQISSDPTRMPSGNVNVYDLATGSSKNFPLKGQLGKISLSPDGHTVLVMEGGGSLENLSSLDLNSGRQTALYSSEVPFRLKFTSDGKWVGGILGNSFLRLQTDSVCVERKIQVEKKSNCEDCRQNSVFPAQATFSQLLERTLCDDAGIKSFDQEAWDREAPLPRGDQLSRDQAKRLLMRFQKPKGFNPTAHLPALLGILDSDLSEEEPDLVLGALQTVLLSSNLLYEKILEMYPKFRTVKPRQVPSACRTPQDLNQLNQVAEQYLKYLLGTNDPEGVFRARNMLGPLSPLLAALPPEKKEEAIDLFAQKLADAAADTSKFHQVFLSKLYKFTTQAVAPLFGEKVKPLTDLTLIREAGRVTPMLLGVNELDGDSTSQTRYGFYAKALRPIVIPSEADQKESGKRVLADHEVIRWKMGDQQFQSELTVQVDPQKPSLLPQGPSPRYDQLWKSGTLTGLVITGSNMTGLASTVMEEYLSYYQNQGFKFEPVREIQDVSKFLRDKTESGELGYLIKEAHSDGDEKNLFRLDMQARMQVGLKSYPDGRKERVYLVFPSTQESQSELLTNEEFGRWLRMREENGHGQLTYFNTSCWSKAKAIHEIEAARTPLLLNIPSTTTVDTFVNDVGSAEHILFTAFREGKSFEQMRKLLQADEGYKNGTSNVFIFPDETSYQESINHVLATPLKIELKIQGPDGRPYQLDQVHE